MEPELRKIRVIALVDVMHVLLVIVLTTATFISTGRVPLELVKAKEAGDRKDLPVVISLTTDGSRCVNDQVDRFVQRVDEVRGLGFHDVRLEVVQS